MNYNVYFDVIRDGYQGFNNHYWIYIAAAICIVLLGVDLYAGYKLKKITLRPVLGLLVMIFVFWNFNKMNNLTTSHEEENFKNLADALNSGNYSTVEGPVKNVRVRHGRINRQFFTVNRVDFEISDNELDGGFNRTIMDDGPLRENVFVRLSYIESYGDKIILRVEIAQQK